MLRSPEPERTPAIVASEPAALPLLPTRMLAAVPAATVPLPMSMGLVKVTDALEVAEPKISE